MRTKTGIERLRQIVELCNGSRESTFDDLDVIETIRLAEACLNSDLDVWPDNLTEREKKYAVRNGLLPWSVAKRFLMDE